MEYGGALGGSHHPSWVLLPRDEHRKHSPACAFLSLQKDVADLTLQEFLKLDKERMRNMIVRASPLWGLLTPMLSSGRLMQPLVMRSAS